MSQFEEHDIEHAQRSLDEQPSFSPYWETGSGQDDLEVIQTLSLAANTTEDERRQMHREAMREALEFLG